VRVRYPHGNIPLFAFLTFLFLPTIIFNSAYWGQVDIIYTTALLACLYLFLKDRPTLAMIAFGLAISTKLQAIFLAPVLVILFMNNKTSLTSFLQIPVTYVCMILPAWLIGRPWPDLLTIYLAQGKTYHALTMNAPNLYTWIPNTLYYFFVPAGLLITTFVAIGLIALTYKRRSAMTPDTLIALAAFSVMAMPFFLPKMHDRYFYPADVFSLLLGFYFPKFFPIPLLMQFVSLLAYCPFLFKTEPVPLEILAVVLLVTLLTVARHLDKQLRP
jgi:Gpi18-like mannosyltransferase